MASGQKPWFEVVANTLSKDAVLGYDPILISPSSLKARSAKMNEINGITMKVVEQNLVDVIWTDRPSPCLDPAFIHEQ